MNLRVSALALVATSVIVAYAGSPDRERGAPAHGAPLEVIVPGTLVSYALPRSDDSRRLLALLVSPLLLVQLLQLKTGRLSGPLDLAGARRTATAMAVVALCTLHWILFQPSIRGGQDFIYFQF